MDRQLLVVTPDFPPVHGGIQTLVHGLALALERYHPYVVTLSNGHHREFDRAQPFDIERIRTPSGLHKTAIAALNARGLTCAHRRRPAAVLSGHIVAGPAAVAMRRLHQVPAIQLVYGDELNRRRSLARGVLTRVDATLAVSRHTALLAMALGVPRSRVHVVHPGVDAPDDAGPGAARQEPWIVVVSRLEEHYKGHDVLLRTLPLVLERIPDAHLHVIGEGTLRGHLESLARAVGVSESVTFHGRLDGPARDTLMRRSSVFAMLSRVDARGSGEGFGIVYLEAGRFGLPVVAGRAAGPLDAVVDGETGILVDPKSHVEAADAIVTLLINRDLAQRMGAAGRSRAREFTWRRAAKHVEDVLDLVSQP